MKISEQKQWRRRRLSELLDELGQANLAEQTGIAAAYLYQMSKGAGDSARNISDRTVERLEKAVDRPGWFAAPSAPAPFGQTGTGAIPESEPTDAINIRQFDVRASMGLGADAPGHADVVREVQVNLPELRRMLPTFSKPENLQILTGYGDSMRPTYHDGDPIIVDVGVSDVTVDGVYVLEREGPAGWELFVKRLQRQLDGSLMMISDNPQYPPQHITEADRGQFKVSGRALGVWTFSRL